MQNVKLRNNFDLNNSQKAGHITNVKHSIQYNNYKVSGKESFGEFDKSSEISFKP